MNLQDKMKFHKMKTIEYFLLVCDSLHMMNKGGIEFKFTLSFFPPVSACLLCLPIPFISNSSSERRKSKNENK